MKLKDRMEVSTGDFLIALAEGYGSSVTFEVTRCADISDGKSADLPARLDPTQAEFDASHIELGCWGGDEVEGEARFESSGGMPLGPVLSDLRGHFGGGVRARVLYRVTCDLIGVVVFAGGIRGERPIWRG